MIPRLALTAVAAGLGGCGHSSDGVAPQAVRACEGWIQNNLGYRSDYRRNGVRQALGPERSVVRIGFEGTNTFGVRIDGEAYCVFTTQAGRLGRFLPQDSFLTDS